MDDLTLHKLIVKMAEENTSPRDIERELQMSPYTIHTRFHKALMLGYSRYFRKHQWNANMDYKRCIRISRVRKRLDKLIAGECDE